MDEKKFGNILTVVLIVLIVAIVGGLIYFGYSALSKKKIQSNSDNAVQQFDETVKKSKKKTESEEEQPEEVIDSSVLDKITPQKTEPQQTEDEKKKVYLDGFEVIGKIKIPKTKVEYPILEKVTKKSLEKAIAFMYGVGLNKPGNSTLMGHNYRNGLFFSNNKNLTKGDKILITDADGVEMTYIIYDMFYTSPDDADYMLRDTQGRIEVSLSTCSDDSSERLIILAAVE